MEAQLPYSVTSPRMVGKSDAKQANTSGHDRMTSAICPRPHSRRDTGRDIIGRVVLEQGANLKGGLRQPRPGPDRAGRRHHLPQPGLSDPRLRLHHRRRGDPPRAGPVAGGLSLRHQPGGAPTPSPPPSVLIVSYPSNPTAQWVDLDFYKDAVIALAKKHDMLVLSDIAYSEIYFDDNPPPSILQVEGARGHRRRGQFAVQDLRHGRLAGRHGGRQRADVRGAGAGEVLSRLRRLHARSRWPRPRP